MAQTLHPSLERQPLDLVTMVPILLTCMSINVIGLVPSTSVNVALNNMMASLGMDLDLAQWVATGWLAATTVTMLMTDYLVRRFGTKPTLTFCLFVYVATSIAAGIAPNPEVLILSRIVQGAAVGPMAPITMLVIFQAAPMHHRGKAMGTMAVGIILAPTFAPGLAGWLAEQLDWRLIFLATAPPALLCIPAIKAYIPEDPPQPEGTPPPTLDTPGIISMSAAIFIGLLGASWGAKYGWRSDQVQSCLLISAFSFVLFILIEWNSKNPMVHLRIFKNVKFSMACILSFVMGIGLYGSSYLTPLFVQTIQGMSQLDSGLLFIIPGLIMAVVFPLSGWIIDLFGARLVLIPGLLILALSNYLLATIDWQTSAASLIFMLALGRIGLGAIMPSLTVASMSALPPNLSGQASGVSNYTRQLGGAIGINILSVHLGLSYLRSLSATRDQLTWDNSAMREAMIDLSLQFNAAGQPFWDTYGMAFGWLGGQTHNWALTEAFRTEFLLTTVLTLLCVPIAMLVNSRYTH